MRLPTIALGASMAVALFAGTMPKTAPAAEFGIVPGSVTVQTLDGEGHPDTRAGGHPSVLSVSFQLESEGTGTGARDYIIEFDPGLGGNPSAAPTCPRPVFEDESCPPDTKVGEFKLQFNGEPITEPLYNIAPAPKQLAAFGFKPIWKTMLAMDLRPTDYGLRLRTSELPQFSTGGAEVNLWGVPADHLETPPPDRIPFLTMPTTCSPLKVTFRTRSWEVGAPWLSETGEGPPLSGCASLPFAPRLDFGLSDRTPDSSTGARIELNVPEHAGADEVISSSVKDVRIDLPPGVTISPGGAEGLVACTDAQFGAGSETPVACPSRSRVGSVEISTPEFPEPLSGSVYLGEERSGERFRLFVGAPARGVEFKALGKLISDPQTGQLSAVLSGLPQLSFSRFSLNFDAGSGALLATPLTCGSKTAQGHFVPYSGAAAVNSSATVDIIGAGGLPCPSSLPFSPGVVAGSTQIKAGQSGDFLLTLTRQPDEQLPSRFSVTLPAGVGAALGSINPCASAAAASATCPGDSAIGSAVAEIGSGATPALVHGSVYLTNAYKGAPFGLSIVFDASVGPFELGTLQVRGTLRLDRRTGQITIATDPLPTIFAGIPLRFRTIGMDLDRSGLLRNPTSCQPKAIVSTIHAVDGQVASISSPFAVRGCNKIAFRPTFESTLTDRSELREDGHPGVRFAVRMKKSGANLGRFRVAFPRLLAFYGGGVKAICTPGDAAEDACPGNSRVGTGIGHTPLVRQPLRGPIYLVQPEGNGLPGLWSSLGGSGVKIDVAGRTLRQNGHLMMEMAGLPDMPLSSFTMSIAGGESGLFSLKEGLCRSGHSRRLVSPVTAEAQNGAYRLGRPRLRSTKRCGSAARARARIGGVR